jgi:asparagine synthase (glutamine-hydrolysing)
MCGFAGFVDHADRIADPAAALRLMSAAVAHRGPDGEGTWFEPRTGVGIAHRRLAILDRSPAGAQPMVSVTGRWVVAYNGELWNFRELRRDLEARGGRVGDSIGDTAVLCAALEAHGAAGALPLLDGMFAFAALDLHERALWLARDRMGVKPCFWGHAEVGGGANVFVFGSELRALAACPGFRNRVSAIALAEVLSVLAVRGERTAWEGLHALEPGHSLRLDLPSGRIDRTEWFSVRRAAAAARREGFHGDRAAMVRAGGSRATCRWARSSPAGSTARWWSRRCATRAWPGRGPSRWASRTRATTSARTRAPWRRRSAPSMPR